MPTNLHNFGRPDWVPADLAERLAHKDSDIRAAAIDEATPFAKETFEVFYWKQEGEILRPRLPVGVSLLEGDVPMIEVEQILQMSLQEINELAASLVEKNADGIVEECVFVWASGVSSRVISNSKEQGTRELESMLCSSIDELGDGTEAQRCSLFWLGIGTSSLPPSWKDVSSIIRDNPEAEKLGFDGMSARGWVPPPWLTACIT